ncbi:lipid A biosynthesis lauroyl acyltransferase [Roseomonas elaeocarpi]|uniref:Lipid A biosynthesis lauroyl acyltransferase n=1 Tax=Roseomonas elaeocarpi TaxID=907779 RepID=A0ABV6JTG9_9PROT
MQWRDRGVAVLVRGLFAAMRALGPDRAPRLGSAVCRRLGPRTKAHRIALGNIRAAFPDQPAEWHDRVADEAWDNLGRTACEYVHLGHIWDLTEERRPGGRVEIDDATFARFKALREHEGPVLVFAAHLANWELPAVAARKHGLKTAVLYRTPNNRPVADLIRDLRRDLMGEMVPAGLTAPTRLAKALQEGTVTAMLVDQRFGRGPEVEFLGRPAAANPLLANLARRFDCPVHGARAIRLPGGRFRVELTEAIPMPRDEAGQVSVDAATQRINDVIAGWIREYPGQWLWMHRRWR